MNHNASWKDLPWRKFEAKTLDCQCRINNAVKHGQIKQAIKLQKLLIKSLSTHLIAVRKITGLSINGTFTDTDNNSIGSSKEKFKIALKTYSEIDTWKHGGLKQLKTFNSNYLDTQLKIANIDDMVVQYIWKIALEPAQKFFLPNNLYMFNSASYNLNLQKAIIFDLINGFQKERKFFLKMTLSTHFNESDYKAIIKKLIFPSKYKNGIFTSLKVGVLGKDLFEIPHFIQKVSIAPLLASVGLYGSFNTCKFKNKEVYDTSRFTFVFCYTNKVLLTLKSDKNKQQIIKKIDLLKKQYIITKKIIGLDLFDINNGFDFLDWKFIIKKNGKVSSYPTKQNWLYHKKKIKQTLRNSKYTIEIRIKLLKKISKNWNSYHRYCDMSKMDTQIYYLKNWYSFYIKSNTKMIKEKRISTLKEIFQKDKQPKLS